MLVIQINFHTLKLILTRHTEQLIFPKIIFRAKAGILHKA